MFVFPPTPYADHCFLQSPTRFNPKHQRRSAWYQLPISYKYEGQGRKRSPAVRATSNPPSLTTESHLASQHGVHRPQSTETSTPAPQPRRPHQRHDHHPSNPSHPASHTHTHPGATKPQMDPSSTILVLTLLLTLLAILSIITCLYRRYWSEWLWRIYHHHPRRGAAADDEENSIGGGSKSSSSSASGTSASSVSSTSPAAVPGMVPVMFPAPVFAAW